MQNHKTNTPSKVYLIGAGPGDPTLITVRAQTLLTQADAILYDHLVSTQLLNLAPEQCERIYVGKRAGKHLYTQNQINQLLIDHAKKFQRVVRLKGGDPFVFGRGAEEALALQQAGIDFEIVPGITAGIAVPAYAGIPVTHRGLASDVAFITGHDELTRIDDSQIDWNS
ncbi:MAG: uroporphyrinogen-III C-methyltransferase, partial [Planctomycetes bacterium]|nr:uroporphyrinogen-III C-methyltransferase [Planctomycetota bacterium]